MADVARKIKTTLALDGEKAFNSAMAEASRNMKVLGSEMKLNTAEFRQSGSSLESLTSKQKTLGSMQDQQKAIVESLTKAVADSAVAYGESDKRTDAYAIKLNNAKAELVSIEGQLDRTGQQIENFSKETESAEKKTIDWSATLQSLDDQLDKGIQVVSGALVAVAAFGTAIAAAGKQAWDATVEMGQFADGLLTTAEQTGISTTALQEWGYASQFIDTELNTITGSITKMVKGLLDAKDGTGKNAEAFAQLGVSIVGVNGDLLGSEEIFFSAIDALGKIENATERDAIAMQLFGKSAQELNPLINAGSAAFKELGQEATAMGLVLSEDTVGKFGQFDDSMNVMKGTIQSVKNSFITAMLPAMEKIQEMVQKLVGKFNDWLKSDGAQALLASLTDKVIALADKFGNDLDPIVNAVIGTFDRVLEVIGWAIDNMETLKTVVLTLTGLLVSLKIAQLAVNAAQLLMNISMAANPIGIVIIAIAGLVTGITLLIKNWDSVRAAGERAWDKIQEKWATARAFFDRKMEDIMGAFSDVGAWFHDVGTRMVQGIWSGIDRAKDWLKTKLKTFTDTIVGWFSQLFDSHSPSRRMAKEVGLPIAQGIALGISANMGLVSDAIGDFDPLLNMSVATKTNQNVLNSFSGSAIADLAGGIASSLVIAMGERDDMTIVLNDREFGRAVRKVAMA